VGVLLFHAEEWTDRYEKLIVVFRKFANAPIKLNRKHALLRVSILLRQLSVLLVIKMHLANKNKFQIHVIVIERVTSSISVDIISYYAVF
jgi:hypothetical protein